MKITYVNRPNWSRVLSKRFFLDYINDDYFQGFASIILLDKVKEPLIVPALDFHYCIADDGYIWLQHLPDKSNYALTTMFNRDREIVQWYFDISLENRVDSSGIPYFIDLYLDIVVLATGEIILLDEDDLADALSNQVISHEEYKLAYATAEKLIAKLKSNQLELLKCTQIHLEQLLALVKN